jgi:single-strand DNA-binding protein
MASLNKIILIGNVGKDPEIRKLQGGDEIVATFSLATSDQWTNRAGVKQEVTAWHNVEVFGKTATVIRDYVTKGKSLYVEGSIKYDEYTDNAGVKRNVTKVRVSGFNSRIVLLGSKHDATPTTKRAEPEPAEVDPDDGVPF